MTASFVLSLDTELAWGTFDKGGATRYKKHLGATRGEIQKLLGLLEKYEIPATWAIVGHLFLRECNSATVGEDPHPDVLTPRYSWYPYHWHHMDPGSNRESAPFWYGDDVVEAIRNAKPAHDVGCHTFSHVIMNDPAVTHAIATSQVRKCCDLAHAQGITLRSFIFPRHGIAHLDVINENGFTSYRGHERIWYRNLPRPISRLLHLMHAVLGITPPVYSEIGIDHSGLVNIPASMFLMPKDGLRCLIPWKSRIVQARRGIQEAIRKNGVFHLWFHPWNLGGSPQMIDCLEDIFRTVASHREKGQLRAVTMKDLAQEILADAAANPGAVR